MYQERTYGLGLVIGKEDSVELDREIAVNPIKIKPKTLKYIQHGSILLFLFGLASLWILLQYDMQKEKQMSEHDSTEKFYIAGPMSGYVDHNAAAFYEGERALIAAGIPQKNIFNPIRHEGSLMVQQGLVKDTQEAYRMCMAIDCEWICKHATAMYMLRGWEKSRGATAEHALAICLGITIVYE